MCSFFFTIISLPYRNNYLQCPSLPQFAICFTPFGVPAPSLPVLLLPFLAQQRLFHSLSVRPPPQPLFLFLSFWDSPLSTLPVSVLSSVSHHKCILPQEQVTALFCTANTLLSQISLTALLYSPLDQDYYFPQHSLLGTEHRNGRNCTPETFLW